MKFTFNFLTSYTAHLRKFAKLFTLNNMQENIKRQVDNLACFNLALEMQAEGKRKLWGNIVLV